MNLVDVSGKMVSLPVVKAGIPSAGSSPVRVLLNSLILSEYVSELVRTNCEQSVGLMGVTE